MFYKQTVITFTAAAFSKIAERNNAGNKITPIEICLDCPAVRFVFGSEYNVPGTFLARTYRNAFD